ncbi:MAG: hypothetical protein WEG40_07685, partial [Candidatus Rokuibacteriota bacterium]
SGANTEIFTLRASDLESPAFFQCAVTGTNSSGAATVMSPRGGQSLTFPQPNPRVDGIFSGQTHVGAEISDATTVETTVVGANYEVCTAAVSGASGCKIGVAETAVAVEGDDVVGQFGSNQPQSVAVDSNGVVYATDNRNNFGVTPTRVINRVQKFTPQGGVPELVPAVFGGNVPAPGGAPTSTTRFYENFSLAIGAEDKLLVEKRFPSEDTTCPAGMASINERRVQEISNDGSTLLDTHGVCGGLDISGAAGLGTSTTTGDVFLPDQSLDPGQRVYILNETTPPGLNVDVPTPTPTSATVTGTIEPNPEAYPNPPGTSYYLEFKLNSEPESAWTRYLTPIDVGNGSAPVPFSTTLFPLSTNTTYDVRVVALKEFQAAKTVSTPQTFTTPAAPPERGSPGRLPSR